MVHRFSKIIPFWLLRWPNILLLRFSLLLFTPLLIVRLLPRAHKPFGTMHHNAGEKFQERFMNSVHELFRKYSWFMENGQWEFKNGSCTSVQENSLKLFIKVHKLPFMKVQELEFMKVHELKFMNVHELSFKNCSRTQFMKFHELFMKKIHEVQMT